MERVAAAREGDLVSCGKHIGCFYIIGGVQSMWDEGRKLAGTLESFSSCPCQSRLINSILDCYFTDTEASDSSTLPSSLALTTPRG
ncbi:hypothetical protein AB7044_01990 [Providencia stuartii]|uniref:hypothetical protein n=1 Tax=Providencia stuartii TaxID=588 RepID=UPI0034E55690